MPKNCTGISARKLNGPISGLVCAFYFTFLGFFFNIFSNDPFCFFQQKVFFAYIVLVTIERGLNCSANKNVFYTFQLISNNDNTTPQVYAERVAKGVLFAKD